MPKPKGKGTSQTKKRCVKPTSYPCGFTCIARKNPSGTDRICHNILKNQAKTFTLWLALQEERLAKVNKYRTDKGRATYSLNDSKLGLVKNKLSETAKVEKAIAPQKGKQPPSEIVEKMNRLLEPLQEFNRLVESARQTGKVGGGASDRYIWDLGDKLFAQMNQFERNRKAWEEAYSLGVKNGFDMSAFNLPTTVPLTKSEAKALKERWDGLGATKEAASPVSSKPTATTREQLIAEENRLGKELDAILNKYPGRRTDEQKAEIKAKEKEYFAANRALRDFNGGKSVESPKSDLPSLEMAFINADRIGGKYQTTEEKAAFQKQLNDANNAIADSTDKQFPNEDAPVTAYKPKEKFVPPPAKKGSLYGDIPDPTKNLADKNRKGVEKMIAMGKTVPKEVLAKYPDLEQKVDGAKPAIADLEDLAKIRIDDTPKTTGGNSDRVNSQDHPDYLLAKEQAKKGKPRNQDSGKTLSAWLNGKDLNEIGDLINRNGDRATLYLGWKKTSNGSRTTLYIKGKDDKKRGEVYAYDNIETGQTMDSFLDLVEERLKDEFKGDKRNVPRILLNPKIKAASPQRNSFSSQKKQPTQKQPVATSTGRKPAWEQSFEDFRNQSIEFDKSLPASERRSNQDIVDAYENYRKTAIAAGKSVYELTSADRSLMDKTKGDRATNRLLNDLHQKAFEIKNAEATLLKMQKANDSIKARADKGSTTPPAFSSSEINKQKKLIKTAEDQYRALEVELQNSTRPIPQKRESRFKIPQSQAMRTKKPFERYRPNQVTDVPISILNFDPKRFQYKLVHGETGSSGSLTGVGKWNPNLAGVVQVWKDPSDNKIYVVNGHNRASLAKKLGVEKITVRFLDVPSAAAARATGALTNIAEGRGNALDAGKFFRDSGLSRQDLAKEGIPMKEAIAVQGLALATLPEHLFARVVLGEMSVARAAELGCCGLSHHQMDSLSQLIEQSEKKGKIITNAAIAELVETVKSSDTQKVEIFDLFGNSAQDQSLAIEKASLQSKMKSRLSREKKLFGTVGKTKAAKELERGGNQINKEESAKIAEEADIGLRIFDQLKNVSSPISDLLNEAARRITNGESRSKTEDEIYSRIVAVLPTLNVGGKSFGSNGTKEGDGAIDDQPTLFSEYRHYTSDTRRTISQG